MRTRHDYETAAALYPEPVPMIVSLLLELRDRLPLPAVRIPVAVMTKMTPEEWAKSVEVVERWRRDGESQEVQRALATAEAAVLRPRGEG